GAEAPALATLERAFQSPVNFRDTAAAYGDGESERRIGLVLREFGGLPAGYVVCTKADRNLRTGEFSGEQIARSVDRSLRLLGLDRLALVFLHDPEHTTFERVMAGGGPLEVLQRFKDQGVIEHLGIAGGPVDLLRRYVDTRAFEVVITHNRYTLLHRSAEPLIVHATRMGVAVPNAPRTQWICSPGPSLTSSGRGWIRWPNGKGIRRPAASHGCRDDDGRRGDRCWAGHRARHRPPALRGGIARGAGGPQCGGVGGDGRGTRA